MPGRGALPGRCCERALELGVNLIDTADVYGQARGERSPEALHPYPDGLVIATKGGRRWSTAAPAADGRPEYLRAACERSLRRLRVDTIDLYQLHMPDPKVPIEESVGALEELRAEGKIRQIGVSNVFGDELERALDEPRSSRCRTATASCTATRTVTCGICERGVSRTCPRGHWQTAHSPQRRKPSHRSRRRTARRQRRWRSRGCCNALPRCSPFPAPHRIEHLEENVRAAGLQLSKGEADAIAAPAPAKPSQSRT